MTKKHDEVHEAKPHILAAGHVYQCPVCHNAVRLTADDLSKSAIFCPTCVIHRETKDWLPAKG